MSFEISREDPSYYFYYSRLLKLDLKLSLLPRIKTGKFNRIGIPLNFRRWISSLEKILSFLASRSTNDSVYLMPSR